MRYTILFIVTLVLVSGFIAYFGDLLGRKMGKRRLTLFGLRPRHTAIVITTLTGMLIAMITLATMITVSKPLREVLVAGERMSITNRELSGANEELRDEGTKLRKQSKNLNSRLLRQMAQQRQALIDLQDARNARDEAQNKVNDAERRVAQLSKSIKENLLQLAELKETRAANEQQLAELEDKLASRQKEIEATKEELEQRQADLNEAKDRLEAVLSKVAEQNQTIADQDEQIREQLQKLNEAQTMFNSYVGVRVGDICFRQGEELYRKVVLPGSYFKVRGELLSILEEVSDSAKDRGAAIGENGRTVQLVSDAEPISEQDNINSWTRSIMLRNLESVVVQVVSSGNSVKGEQAKVEFRIYRNKMAFKQGSTIAKTKSPIDGSQSEGRILTQVVAFLQNDVHDSAAKAGVVPIANSEPTIKDEQLDELLALTHQIRVQNCPVEIKAVAEHDIYSAGPLNLRAMDFSISPLKKSAQGG